MLKTILTTAFIILFTISLPYNRCIHNQKSDSKIQLVDITYEKMLIDGVWWIYVYQDGVLIEYYPELTS